MKRDSQRREAWRDLCAGLREDDGIDPRRRGRADDDNKPNEARVAGRLCRQVQRAIQLALQGCADAVLRDLFVSDVQPAPDLSRLQVTVAVQATDRKTFEAHAAALSRAHGLLRSQVARAISRKRTPELLFVLEPEAPGAPGTPGTEVRP